MVGKSEWLSRREELGLLDMSEYYASIVLI